MTVVTREVIMQNLGQAEHAAFDSPLLIPLLQPFIPQHLYHELQQINLNI